jgi:negative regulator of flagellin synthesis FlgM
MRIDANNPLSNPLMTESAAAKSSKSGKAPSAPSTDNASFSANAGEVSALEASVLAAPEVRQDKVASLRDAIRNGSYQIDPSQIADAMLNEAAS